MLRQNPADTAHPSSDGAPRRGSADALSVFTEADLPWYGLDAGWQGPRDLGSVSTGPDGLVEFGRQVVAHRLPPEAPCT